MGTLLKPEDGLIAIGSGGPYAQAAARAMLDNTSLDAKSIVERSLEIAANICIYTNHSRTVEVLKKSMSSVRTPREIVQELDKHIVGQNTAKRAVAIAVRNRWRRMQLDDEMRDEVTPKNILIDWTNWGRQN